MVLRNWYNLMKAYRAQQVIEDGLTTLGNSTDDAGYYDSNYMLPYITFRPNNGLTFYTNPSGSGAWFIVGSGTTPATLDDYKLEAMITSGLGCSVEISVDEDNDAIYKLTLTNSSNNDITIGEVGIFGKCYTGKGSSSSTRWALVERTVLDSPITIPAGGIGMLDYAIKIPIPTA